MSKEIITELLKYKDKPDNDDIRFKEIVKQKLLNNEKIIYVLNNKELQDSEAEADEYFGVNILPYYMISPTQTNVQNFLCYEIQFAEESRYNQIIKYVRLIFYVLCEQKSNIEVHTGIARHDLLQALLLEEFNWSNCFGNQIHCVSDKPSVTDNDYNTRTIIFEGKVTNGVVKTMNNVSRVFNNNGINR